MLSKIVIPFAGLIAILVALLQVTASPVELEGRDIPLYTAKVRDGYSVTPCKDIAPGFRVGLGATTFPHAQCGQKARVYGSQGNYEAIVAAVGVQNQLEISEHFVEALGPGPNPGALRVRVQFPG